MRRRPFARRSTEAGTVSVVGKLHTRNADYTIRYQGKIYQIGREEIRTGMRSGRVRVESRLDGSLAVHFRDRYVSAQERKPQPKPASRPKMRPEVRERKCTSRSDWMANFNLRKSPPLWAIVKAEGTTSATRVGAAPFFR